MKIKRFFAQDMRQAIRMVREAQGPDAVILSNRKVNGGVEIVSAIDYDASTHRAALPPELAADPARLEVGHEQAGHVLHRAAGVDEGGLLLLAELGVRHGEGDDLGDGRVVKKICLLDGRVRFVASNIREERLAEQLRQVSIMSRG